MNGEQLVISPDRDDLVFLDLVLIADGTSVAQHNGGRQFFIQVHPVNVVHVGNIVEILNVQDIVPVQVAADIHGLRISGAVQHADVASQGFLSSLDVALGANVLDVADISEPHPDVCQGALMNLVQDLGDPALVRGQHFGSAGLDILKFREQQGQALGIKAVGQFLFVAVRLHGGLQGADIALLGHFDDLHLVAVAQGVLFHGLIVKQILFHGIFLLNI